ncbi:MAG: DNA repair protein RadA [Planctomycetes bacterium]|nr:DNA repair protein RadA [Planctomycetota bacterium]
MVKTKKSRTHYVCRSCGGSQSQWIGKCPDCGTWDSLERFTEASVSSMGSGSASGLVELWTGDDQPSSVSATPLPEIESESISRKSTGINELDRVLGGGLVAGSVVLLGGEPGIGKSTILLQAAGKMAGSNSTILYVSSEESAYQTRLRAERLMPTEGQIDGLDSLYILADTNLARIVEQARKVKPSVMIIDSVQMIYKSDLDASPGSVSQLRRCCTELVYLAKVSGMTIVLVGHVTKDGQLAGPKLLEHLVDVVLSFEGDRHHGRRVVRGMKNRYGTTLEVGLFEMTGSGLKEIPQNTALLDPNSKPQPGSVICPAIYGSRCLLAEIQALTATGFLGAAKRRASGIDPNRLAMLIAVLEKHGGLRLADQDVFTSAVGGLRVVEPGADLALCLAIAGAHFGKSLKAGVSVIGEIGLGGEIRPVHQTALRIKESVRQGYRTVLGEIFLEDHFKADFEHQKVVTIGQALEMLQ